MGDRPVPLPELTRAALVEGGEEADRLLALLDAGTSPETRRAYRSTWRAWAAWTKARGLEPVPASPETVALWIADRAPDLAVSSIRRHLAAISVAHASAGCESPVHAPIVRTALRGAARLQAGTRPIEVARPFSLAELRAVVDACPPGLAGARDRAILLLGVAGGLRRSELAALDLRDVRQVEEGIELSIRTSKVDQEGEGYVVPILPGQQLATCPVRAVLAWVGDDREDRPLFERIDRWGTVGGRMGGRAIAEVIRRAAQRAGLDPGIRGHSLRATFATLAARAGAPERDIARIGRWASIATLRRYVRDADRWRDHPLRGSGL